MNLAPSFRVWIRRGCWALGLYAAFAAGSWLGAPWAVRRVLREVPRALPGFDARVSGVRFNPFALSLTVDGFALSQAKLGDLATCDQFYVSFQPLDLLRLTLGLRDLRLTRPRLIAVIAADGTSVVDYLPKSTAPAEAVPSRPAKAPFIPRAVIRRFAIVGGAVELESRLASAPQKVKVDPIDLALEHLSTLPDDQGSYKLSGRSDRGESFSWTGKLTVRPARLTGSIAANGLDLSREATAAPSAPVILSGGRLDLSTDYQLAFGDGVLAATLTQARAAVRDMMWNLRGASGIPRGPFALIVGPARVELRAPVSLAPGTKVTLAVDARVAGSGSVKLDATAIVKPPRVAAELHASRVPLAPFSPLAPPPTQVVIDTGAASLDAKVAVSSGGADITGEASFALDGFSLSDAASRRALVKLSRLSVEGARVATKARTASIDRVRLDKPFLRLFRGASGRTNVEDALGISFASAAAVAQSSAPIAAPAPKGRRETPWLAKLKRFELRDGRVVAQDEGVAPAFSLAVQKVSADVSGLSTDGRSTATFRSNGFIEKAPFSVAGTVRLSSAAAWVEAAIKAEAVQLRAFTPYSIKVVGYKLDKGTVSVDLKETLAVRAIDTRNKVTLDQLTLGEKVESPDALKVPVKLGLAILKDRRGVIDFDVPIQGSLDDPQFRLLPVVLRTLVNLVVKAAASPFSALGKMLGSSGDLGRVAFDAGSATLSADAASNLDKVVKALDDRPALSLGARGAAAKPDALALGDLALRRRLRGQAGEPALTPSEEKKVLALYQKELGAAAPAVAEARMKLDEKFAPGEAELHALAVARVSAIQDYLAGRGVAAGRFFSLEASVNGQAPDPAPCELQLDAR